MKKIFLMLLLLSTLSACQNPMVDIQIPQTQKTEIVNTFGVSYMSSENLNPLISTSDINSNLSMLIYESLFTLDENFDPIPVLCSTYQNIGDTYIIDIKPNVAFHSGKILKADDVAFSLNLARNTANSPYFSSLSSIKSIKVLSDTSLQIVLSSPNNKFLSLLNVPIIEKGSENLGFSIGTGPYRPVITTDEVYLTAFANWNKGHMPNIARINLENIVQSDEQVYSFELGNLSLISNDRLSANPVNIRGNAIFETVPTSNMHYIGFNHKKAIFSDANTRIAMNYMIDRTEIASSPLQGYIDASNEPYHKTFVADTNIDINIELALNHFKNSGLIDINSDGILDYKNSPFSPEILVNGDNLFKKAAATRFVSDLSIIGINAKLKSLPFDEYQTALRNGDFDMYYAETRLTNDYNISAIVNPNGAINYGNANFITSHSYSDLSQKNNQEAIFLEQFNKNMPIAIIGFAKKQVLLKSGISAEFKPLPFNYYNGAYLWKIGE